MSDNAAQWTRYEGQNIPSSSDLFPVLYRYIAPDSAILDIGCGYGKTALSLYNEEYSAVFGVDINPHGMERARVDAAASGVADPSARFQVADAGQLPFPNNAFDCVMTQAFWTSIPPEKRRPIMSQIDRVLRPSGILYLAVWDQNWENPVYAERYRRGAELGLEHGSFEVIDKATGGVSYVAHHYTRAELDDLLASRGFTIVNYAREDATTQNGNVIGCHVAIARKKDLD